MPFVLIYGIPENTDQELLRELRRDIVKSVVRTMEAPQDWVHPIFPRDLLGPAEAPEDGTSTLYLRLDTALFHGLHPTAGEPLKVLNDLAQLVEEAFDGQYSVEAVVGELHSEWKVIVKASKRPQA